MNILVCLAAILAIANGAWMGQPFGSPYRHQNSPLWSSNNVLGQQHLFKPTLQDQEISGPIGSEYNDASFRHQLLSHEATEETQQKKLFDFINKMEKSIVQPEPGMTKEPLDPSKASQMAQEILQQSRQAELVQLQESLQELQQPSSKSIWALPEVSKVQQLAHEIAVEGLKEFASKYQVGQLPEKKDNLTKLLNETLQVAIKGQMAIHNLQSQQVQSFLITDQLVKNFTIDLQQLLAVNNLLHTQNALVEHQTQARQIQLQQNFLKKQIQKLQVSYVVLSKHVEGTVPVEVTETQQEMYHLQQQLQTQQFAQQMLISRLQQVLISQRMAMRQLAMQQHVQAHRGQFVYGQSADNVLYS